MTRRLGCPVQGSCSTAMRRVGRRLLRSLLHNEVGLVGHRRAWAHHRPPKASLLDLYRGPHRVHDWDRVLVQVIALLQCLRVSPGPFPDQRKLNRADC